MRIIEGEIPETKAWRVLVLLSPDRGLGKAWQLGLALAHANNGQMLTAVVVPTADEASLARARQMTERVKQASQSHNEVTSLIIESAQYDRGIIELVKRAAVDLTLTYADDLIWHDLNRIPCALGAIRGDQSSSGLEDQIGELERVLVPTSGGPNTAHAFNFLLPLTPQIEVTAVYIARQGMETHESALGQARMRHMLNFVGAENRIQTKLVHGRTVIEGIVREASRDYDLVVIGASRESSLDKVLFGDIPAAVVRQSKTPIMIVREPQQRWGKLAGRIAWQLQNIIPRLNLNARTQAYVRIRRSARPSADFFILIGLSALIAALGLIINSPAVVIGAMLVAPLMSPIVGIGMSIVLGDTRFLRLSLGAVARGLALAVFLGTLAGLLQLGRPLTPEILARTQPTLIDLAIALFSGMAGAYALCHSDAAGALPGVAIAAALMPPLAAVGITFAYGDFRSSFGALLLFITNFVAISSAAALVFLALGFRPSPAQKERKQVRARTGQMAVVLVALVAVLLGFTTYNLAQDSRQRTRIYEVTAAQVTEVAGAELADLEIVSFADGRLQLEITARSPRPIPYSRVADLQESIGIQLAAEGIIQDIALTMTVIEVTELDPLLPPTPTPTPTPTFTPTPGPTPTNTPTPGTGTRRRSSRWRRSG
ncbi:MAG: TIGR00341 family protein, partial [Anaerolineae bacterium]